jgi:hypothetical protein
MYVCMCVCICMYLCMYVCVYVCMYVYMYVCMCICMYVMYICMYVCLYIIAGPARCLTVTFTTVCLLSVLYVLCAQLWSTIDCRLFRILKLLASEGYRCKGGSYWESCKRLSHITTRFVRQWSMYHVSDPCFGGFGWCVSRIIITYSRAYDFLLYGGLTWRNIRKGEGTHQLTTCTFYDLCFMYTFSI